MIRLTRAVVVEGKYDRARLSSVIDAPILQTDGFGIFRDKELQALLRRYAAECGLLILTDSDAAGRLIRGRILSVVGEDADVVNLYIPKIRGKERRKEKSSAEGLLGVEGMTQDTLEQLFSRFLEREGQEKEPVTRQDLYEWGLFGAADAVTKREKLLLFFSLPTDLNVNRMTDALTFLVGKEEVQKAVETLFSS